MEHINRKSKKKSKNLEEEDVDDLQMTEDRMRENVIDPDQLRNPETEVQNVEDVDLDLLVEEDIQELLKNDVRDPEHQSGKEEDPGPLKDDVNDLEPLKSDVNVLRLRRKKNLKLLRNNVSYPELLMSSPINLGLQKSKLIIL